MLIIRLSALIAGYLPTAVVFFSPSGVAANVLHRCVSGTVEHCPLLNVGPKTQLAREERERGERELECEGMLVSELEKMDG